jgi:alpha-tubulin suppressor-like RCC1 family protein
VKKLAALLLFAAACGPGLVEFPVVTQGTGPGGGVPGSPEACGAILGAVYCGNATCDTLGVLHCGLNNGVCESCPATYSCSAGACVPPTTCAAGLVVCASGCCTATQVIAGGNTSCAIVGQASSTGVYCWGANESGQAGPAAPTGASTATASEIATLRGASSVALGAAHGCAIVGTSVYCWGRNDAHQLGSGATVSQSADPIKVPEAEGATAIAAGDRHSCAITPAGAVCWGAIAGTFPEAQGATKIVAGGGHTCAKLTSKVLCWGLNDVGQLGNGSTTSSPTPVTPLAGIPIADLTAGFHHTCALVSGTGVDRTNALRCWGANEFGQIDASNASGANRLTPTNVVAFNSSGLPDQVGGGRAHTCVRRGTDLACFGDNSSGQRSLPVVAAASLAVGGDHSCVVDASNLLHCWGRNASSELGPFGP